MCSFYPRTASVIVDSLGIYKTKIRNSAREPGDEIVRLAGLHSSAHAQLMCDHIADACVRSLDRVLQIEPIMPKYLREEVYQWLAMMPGFKGKEKDLRKEFEKVLENKVERDLI